VDLQLKGKAALVAAGTRGIGKGVAIGFAREGADVALCGRDDGALRQAEAEVKRAGARRVVATRADLARAGEPERFVDEAAHALGRVDALFLNAGGPPAGHPLDFTDQQWETAFQTNLMSAVRLIRQAVPHFRRQQGGSVVALTSWSVKQPIPELLLSNSIRLAVVGLMKTLALELGREQIRFNVVCPGRILTDRLRDLDRRRAEREGRSQEDVTAANVRTIPLGRYGTPEDLANLIVFLSSRAASYINGITVQVDGGLVTSTM